MASTKPTAVHFSLVFFVMTTLILFLVWYLTFKEQKTLAQKLEETQSRAQSVEQANSGLLSDIDTLRNLLGVNLEQVGSAGAGDANTLYGSMAKSLNDLGMEQVQPNPQTPNVLATLQSMRSALNAAQTTNNEYQTGLADTESRLRQEQEAARNRAAELQNSQETSEQKLQKNITDQNELLAEKNREIQQTRNDLNAERVAKEQVSDELDRVRRELGEEISLLEKANDFLRDRLNDLENLSFDKPDGKIVRIENSTRRVWINLGSRDNLRTQVTFSVYIRDNRGVGRGRQDIKAKIEVSEVQGPHLAECRIIDEDFDRPIQEGDPIYSPLFSPGVKEYFSFVGIVDMNGDGESDRDLLHDIIENAGGGIEIEVDDLGNRNPPGRKMTVKSKFLVVGEIPDPAELAGFDERRDDIQKIMDELTALEKEARQQGIRKITFGDFLNFIGYENQQRLFVRGENRPFQLKYGARSSSTNEELGSDRASDGSTSGRFRQQDSGSTGSSRFRN
ncbi:hypothetical protein AB1L42_05345 [Thalassoglobus sp. JC818]|uniref:hypothetical protein n=1 Tax=Thalassoglobus sp. JC818 TaxID=3232136 RepID=UPI003457ED67